MTTDDSLDILETRISPIAFIIYFFTPKNILKITNYLCELH